MRDQRVLPRLRTRFVVHALYVLCIGFLCVPPARAQIKPYFLVIVDTSGSMAWCSGGSSGQLGLNDCSCHVGNNCNNPFQTNRCGFPSNRLGDAKCSLQRIIDGVGSDAVFGLMQFEHPCSPTCQDSGDQSSLNACDPLTSNNDDAYDDGQLLANERIPYDVVQAALAYAADGEES